MSTQFTQSLGWELDIVPINCPLSLGDGINVIIAYRRLKICQLMLAMVLLSIQIYFALMLIINMPYY